MTDVVLYATDTMADWEYGYLTAGLAWVEDGPYRLRVLGDGSGRSRRRGGCGWRPTATSPRSTRTRSRCSCCPGRTPGARATRRRSRSPERLLVRGVPVAAICGATYGLARVGLLDERDHTSNAPDFLLPTGYAGAARYRDVPVVEDRDLITAGATQPVDFAAAVFRRLAVFPPAVVDAWHGLYTTGERRYYDALVGAGGA